MFVCVCDCFWIALTSSSSSSSSQLKRLQEEYGHRWAEIARHMGGRTDQQCMGRWRRHLDPTVTRGAWDAKEDAELRALYAALGPKWSRICDSVPGRTAQQCRARWFQIDGSTAAAREDDDDDVNADGGRYVHEDAGPSHAMTRRLAGAQPRASAVEHPTPDAQPFHKILEESARAAAAGSLDPYPMDNAPLLAAVKRFSPTTSGAMDPRSSNRGAESDDRATKRRRDSDAATTHAAAAAAAECAGRPAGKSTAREHASTGAIGVPTPPQIARASTTSKVADDGDKLSFLYTVALNETTTTTTTHAKG